MQVTIIGGGSYQWSPKLIADLLRLPSLAGVHLVLEDIDPVPLEKMGAIARIADDKLGAKSTVSTTTDQRRALEGADFVVVTISTGGFTIDGRRHRRAGPPRHPPVGRRLHRPGGHLAGRCATSPCSPASAATWKTSAPTPGSSTSPTP